MDGGNGIRGKRISRWQRLRVRRPSRRSYLGLVAALAIIVPLVATTGAVAKVPRSFFGVVPWGSFQGVDYQRLDDAKVRNARALFFWPTIEPAPGDFRWSTTDALVGQLAQVNVRVLPFLDASPSWLSQDLRRAPVRTKRARSAWKRFVRASVGRYGRNGTFWREHPEIPKVPIKAWQIWNEQNNSNYFSPRPKPKAYAKLVRLSRRAARSRDKHAKIVLGGMFGKPDPKHSMTASRFLKKLYKAKGAKRSFNVVAVHPYAPTLHNLKRQMSKLRKVIKRNHDNAKMWITEMGWGSAPPTKRWPLLKGVTGQKKMLKKSYHLLIHNHKRWKLQRVYWFLWRDPGPNDTVNCSFCTSAGLFTHDFKPKPAFHAFEKLTHR